MMPAPAGIKSICGRLPEDRWLIISAAILNVILGSQEALQGCLRGTQDVDPVQGCSFWGQGLSWCYTYAVKEYTYASNKSLLYVLMGINWRDSLWPHPHLYSRKTQPFSLYSGSCKPTLNSCKTLYSVLLHLALSGFPYTWCFTI